MDGGGDLHVSESWKHLEVQEALCGVISELGGFCTPPLTPVHGRLESTNVGMAFEALSSFWAHMTCFPAYRSPPLWANYLISLWSCAVGCYYESLPSHRTVVRVK